MTRVRHLLSWKGWFYGMFLPACRRLGPSRGSACLAALACLVALWPPRRRELDRAIQRLRAHRVSNGWDHPRANLARGLVRCLARDCLLDRTSVAELHDRVTVEGWDHVEAASRVGKGVLVLGSHLGAHLAGIHWLVRQGRPVRLLVQRPRHVSTTLQHWFDHASEGPHPQTDFFLNRSLDPAAAARRVFLARDALRAGQIVYLNGDIPWPRRGARPGRLLGRLDHWLSFWTDLACLTGAAVVPLFCFHESAGRYRLCFEHPIAVSSGTQEQSLHHYLARLESHILAHPEAAIPHLTWPSYNDPASPQNSAMRVPRRPHSQRKPSELPL